MNEETPRRVVGIHDKLPILETIPLSLQHLMAMFGATVLVPLLLGVNPGICLLMNGIGTIIYSLVTKGGIPAYLGSSFAFIAPGTLIISQLGSYEHAQIGFMVFGAFFVIMAIIIKFCGVKWIDIVMPPAVMGGVVAVIGLELAPTAASSAGLVPSANPAPGTMIVSLITLAVAIFGSVLLRGFAKIIPILIAVIVGYFVAMPFGLVDLSGVGAAAWVGFPKVYLPIVNKDSMTAILIIAPAMLVVLCEHISHLIVTGNITGTNLIKKPGLHRSLLGDGISNIISGFFGSTPNTTYGENIGVMAITRVYSVWVIRGAAIIAIVFSLIPKFSAVIQSLPWAVIGGVCIYLYGVIAISGIRMLVEKKVDFSKNYNMVLGAIVFCVGVSGATIQLGSVALSGMALSAVTGVVISLFFYLFSRLGWMNEKYDPHEGADSEEVAEK